MKNSDGERESETRYDLSVELAAQLARIGDDGRQLYLQTGIKFSSAESFTLLLELSDIDHTVSERIKFLSDNGLKIPPAYGTDDSKTKYVTARLDLNTFKDFGDIQKHLQTLSPGNFVRVSMPGPYAPLREVGLGDGALDINIPPKRKFGNLTVDGTAVIVGIIDDGCAFARQEFLTQNGVGNAATYNSRILSLWDQTPIARNAPWKEVQGFYGYELAQDDISASINAHKPGGQIQDDEIYSSLDYEMKEPGSHGTHVMDIAAGNGTSLMGSEGVARNADIIFVQLPRDLIEQGGRSVFDKILDGVVYIFAKAKTEGKAAVINISYGAFAGPHDGTSIHEKGIDGLLKNVSNRAVVVAAGNGFESNCHTTQKVKPRKLGDIIRWKVPPEDPTLNLVDIWYTGDAELSLYLTPPGNASRQGPFKLNQRVKDIKDQVGNTVGWVLQEKDDPGNHDNHVVIALLPTAQDWTAQNAAAAPPGTWKIEFRNTSKSIARLDAWIERDAGLPRDARKRQSRFDLMNADPECTLSNLAAANLAISVGAYNTATQEVARYSACGPTRPMGGDEHTIRHLKPEVCAPAEEVPTGKGILSASSHMAQPTRMNGTSAAAPYVSGLIALMFQVAKDQNKDLTVDEVRKYVIGGAQIGATTRSALKPNCHQLAEDRTDRPVKQTDVWADLVGAGRINVLESIKLV